MPSQVFQLEVLTNARCNTLHTLRHSEVADEGQGRLSEFLLVFVIPELFHQNIVQTVEELRTRLTRRVWVKRAQVRNGCVFGRRVGQEEIPEGYVQLLSEELSFAERRKGSTALPR